MLNGVAQSVRELVSLTTQRGSFDKIAQSLDQGNFLDWFYYSETTQEERQEALNSEPDFPEYYPLDRRALLAASTHYLANKYNLETPKWVSAKWTQLEVPYFAADAKNELRLVLLAESPVEFRMRNIFVPEDPLSRC